MPIQNCPIEIPVGWEFVRYGNAEVDETVMDDLGCPHTTATGIGFPRIVIRRARPSLQVGDWVRLNSEHSSFHGKRGQVKAINSVGEFRVEFGCHGGGWYHRNSLTKQTRTIEPYTMDRCITEIVIRGGRDVMRGGEPTEIVTVYSNGVSTDKPYVGFISYGSAAKFITWPNGDAFGVVTWEGAE